MAEVFISYSSADQAIADTLVASLESKGISCWIAHRNIKPGENWTVAITRAIETSSVFIVIYSANSAKSDQCPREIALADGTDGVTVIPYKVDKTPLNEKYAYYLKILHWIKADAKNNDYKFEELYTLVSSAVKKPVLGIDLGTTFSAAAYVDESGNPTIISNSAGDFTTPSVVYFEDDKNVIVGELAKDYLATEPERVISTVKKYMGDRNKTYMPVGESPELSFTPQEISSLILKKIAQDANIYLNKEFKDVAVTVPAYFTDVQRNATIDAVRLAGLNLVTLIHEPTAAAIYYAYKNKMDDAKVLVFDLGGGTFDVTIVHVSNSNVKVLSTSGLKSAGGSFFDQNIVEYVCGEFKKKHNIDIKEYNEIYYDLFPKAERIKRQICANKGKATIPVNVGTVKDRITVSYDYFVTIIEKTCEDIEIQVNSALDSAELSAEDIDQVLMVGGSSRIPYVEEMMTRLIGKQPLRDVNPDQVVALGAALRANWLIKKNAVAVKDVCSHGIGFLRYSPSDKKKKNVVLIPKNTQVPIEAKSENFAFAKDGQEYIDIVVTEGDDENVKYTESLFEKKIALPEGILKGMKYELSLKVNERHDISLAIDIPDLDVKINVGSNECKEDMINGSKQKNFEEQLEALSEITIA